MHVLNRDELAAAGRAVVTLIAGAALLYAIGEYLGWWVVGAIFISGIGAAAWDARHWRPW